MTYQRAKRWQVITVAVFVFIKGQTMTQTQALTKALFIDLIAPSEEKAAQASDLAESIAQGLDFAQVEQCKSDALAIIEAFA
jgi:hypothetical protein